MRSAQHRPLAMQACTWLGDCTDPGDDYCNQKCIFNVFQDFNNQAATVPGQQNILNDLIQRDSDMVAANGCAYLAALIGSCDSTRSILGLSPTDKAALDQAKIRIIADLVCPRPLATCSSACATSP